MLTVSPVQFLEAFMTLANDTPLPNHSKPDFRHVLLPAVLFGLDSKCRGFPGIFPIRWDLRWVVLFVYF